MKNKKNVLMSWMISVCMFAGNAYANTESTWCVFDVVGPNGPSKETVDLYKVEALRWNVSLTTKYFTDDKEAKTAFDNGECDLVNLPDYLVREYNHFTGSINAVGGLPSYDHMGSVIKTLSTPSAQKLMVNGDYEIFGISLIGGIHAFVKDRTWVTPEQVEGKKMAIIDGIPESDYFSEQSGTVLVKTDIGTMFKNFNEGDADLLAAPLLVYEPLEMSQGLGANGGISRYPLSMATMQLVARHSAFPEGVGQKSREAVYDYHLRMVRTIKSYEDKVPEKYYFSVPMTTVYHFDNIANKARKELVEKGIYNAKMLKLLKKVRCKDYPHRAECQI